MAGGSVQDPHQLSLAPRTCTQSPRAVGAAAPTLASSVASRGQLACSESALAFCREPMVPLLWITPA